MLFRNKMAAAVTVTVAAGSFLVTAPQPALAAYDCITGHTAQGSAWAECAQTSPGGDKFRIRWGCINNLTGAFRQQLGNTASVSAGTRSSIPNCGWFEAPHGSRWVETLWI